MISEEAKASEEAEPGSSEQWAALGRLALIVAAGVIAAVLTGTIATVAVIFAIIAMIMLHELGHLATAKWSGMKVTEYFLGFGPRLWSVRHGETEYGMKALPFGGYVKIPGMTNLEKVDPVDEARTYRQQSFPKRLSVAVAGSAMHFILAFLLLWALLVFVGQPVPNKVQINSLVPVVSGTSPAQQAGLHPGDIVVSTNGKKVTNPDLLTSTIVNSAGKPVTLVVNRGGRNVIVRVTPVDARIDPLKGERPAPASAGSHGHIGVELSQPLETFGPVVAVGHAVTTFGNISWQTLQALGHVFSPHGVHAYLDQVGGQASSNPTPGTPRFYSPIGITRLASQAAHAGMTQVLFILILINIFVGIFNMLPVLPLDGGHVAIATYERVRSRGGKRYYVDAAKLMPATYLVVAVLVFLGMTALYLDIARPLSNPFQ